MRRSLGPGAAFFVSVAGLLLACGKSQEPGASAANRIKGLEAYKASPEFKKLSAEDQRRTLEAFREMAEEAPARKAQNAEDRAELVQPPPPGWRPEKEGRHLRLILTPQKTRYRVGERFWYILELKNIGSEPAWFVEHDSFFKSGDRDMGRWKVVVAGREVGRRALPLFSPSIIEPFNPPGFDRLTDEERRAFVQRDVQRANARWRRLLGLNVTLAPGETLRTRPWRFVDAIDAQRRSEQGLSPSVPVKGRFRELGPYRFDAPGTHTIQILFREVSRPATSKADFAFMERRGHSRKDTLKIEEEARKGLLPSMDSNVIAIEVGE